MKLSKKLLAVPALLLTLWGCYKIEFNLITYSGYYAQHLPHKKGTNPELIFTLKYLYYLKKPKNSHLRYDYDGANTIIVNEEYSISGYKKPSILLYDDAYFSPYYYFDKQGKFLFKEILNDKTDKIKHINSKKINKEAESYVERAITPILRVQPKPKLNLQWLFNLIYQRKFE